MDMRISPSILNCDFSDLRGELAKISNADWAHVDIMDGHFVPNLTMGPPIVESITRTTKLPVDCHLMIEAPDRWAGDYVSAGAHSVTFHAEAAQAPVRLARELRALGARAGIGLKPATPIEPYLDILEEFDMILIMTVEPGFGGQKFLDSMMHKVRRTREAVNKSGLDVWIQVDGGVSEKTIDIAADAGADTFVAGSAVYRAADASAEVEKLRALAQAHRH